MDVCRFDFPSSPFRHEIVHDVLTQSNLEFRCIVFCKAECKQETCPLCQEDQLSKFISYPTLTANCSLEWMVCANASCLASVPRLKLKNPVCLNTSIYSIERPCREQIDAQWKHLVDDALSQYIPVDLVAMVCVYDPFHYAQFT